MLHRSLRLFAILLTFGAILSFLPGQEKRLPERISDQTYRVSVDLVNVLCSVFDKKTNSFVTNLTRDDFLIYEDNQPQEIRNFSRETDLPLTIDAGDPTEALRPNSNYRRPQSLSSRGDEGEGSRDAHQVRFASMLQDFTNDPTSWRINQETEDGGGTTLYDAIYVTCGEKLIRETDARR